MKLKINNQEIEISEEQRQKITDLIGQYIPEIAANTTQAKNSVAGTVGEILGVLSSGLKAPDEVDNWPKDGDKYYYLDTLGGIESTTWAYDNPSDKECLELGLVFRTKEEAQAHVSYLKALTRVKGSSSFKPNWNNPSQMKYRVYYEHGPKTLESTISWSSQNIGTPVYYESEEAAEQAIKDHKEDFLILAGVK
jgi:hypothetical protein